MTTLLSNAFTAFTPRSSRVAFPSIALPSATTQASAAVRSSPDCEASPSPSPTQTSSSVYVRITRARHRLSARRSSANSLNLTLSSAKAWESSMKSRWIQLSLVVCAFPALLPAQDVARRFAPFRPGGDTLVAIAFVQPATGRSAWLGADVRVHAASTMKVPVLIELARRVDAGELAWSDSLPVVNDFLSIADGSHYSVDPADDSDPLPYTFIGGKMTVEELARRMTVRSSN